MFLNFRNTRIMKMAVANRKIIMKYAHSPDKSVHRRHKLLVFVCVCMVTRFAIGLCVSCTIE